MPTRNRDIPSTGQTSLESLESRRLLSASLSHGLLSVDGTRRADNITVGFASPRTLRVVVNGQESLFARKAVGKIRVRAGTGDDGVVFLTDAAYRLAVRLVVSGGAGNDSLMGSDSADTLLGEDGNDYIEGWGGNDMIRGGAGNDNLRGRDGDDQVFGDAGNDDLIGMSGDDTLFGGGGDDTLHEDAGRDRVLGGDGLDHFYFTDSPKDVRDEARREAIDREPPVYMPFVDHPIQAFAPSATYVNLNIPPDWSTGLQSLTIINRAIETSKLIHRGIDMGGIYTGGGYTGGISGGANGGGIGSVTIHSGGVSSGTLHLG